LSKASIECKTDAFINGLSYKWYLNGLEINNSSNLDIQILEHRLVFNKLDYELHDGDYTCETILTKKNQKVTSSPFLLQVQRKKI
jgi:hypothetical protein